MIDYNKCKKLKPSLQLKVAKKVYLINYCLGLLIHQNLILVKQTNQLSQRQVLSNEIAPLTLLNGLRVFPKKSVLSLVDFDVKNFYPSISMKLDTDSIKYAKTLIELTNQDLAIIM